MMRRLSSQSSQVRKSAVLTALELHTNIGTDTFNSTEGIISPASKPRSYEENPHHSPEVLRSNPKHGTIGSSTNTTNVGGTALPLPTDHETLGPTSRTTSELDCTFLSQPDITISQALRKEDMTDKKSSFADISMGCRDNMSISSVATSRFEKTSIPVQNWQNMEVTRCQGDPIESYPNIMSPQISLTEHNVNMWITQTHENDMRRTAYHSVKPGGKDLNEPPTPVRNVPITYPLRSLSEYIHHGIKVNPKCNVELRDGDFMRVVDVVLEDGTGAALLRGWIFRRTREMNGILEKKYNELCWILHIDEDDPRDAIIQGMEIVPVTHVMRRRKIRLTNRPFPAFSFREDGVEDSEQTVLNERVLVCRFKYVCSYSNAQMRDRYSWSEKALYRLRAEECDPLLATDDDELRYDWRGLTEKQGAGSSMSREEKTFMDREYQNQNDLRITAQSSAPSSQISRRDSFTSLVSGLGTGHTSTSQPDDDDVEIISSSSKATRSFIDLSNEAYDASLNDSFDTWFTQGTSHQNSSKASLRKIPPDVVEVDAVIKTATRFGTVQRKYRGQVTTKLFPHRIRPLKRKHSGSDASMATKCLKKLEIDSISHNEARDSEEVRGMPTENATWTKSSQFGAEARRYTFGDCFCGAGGVSRGAVMAGLRVEWAFDYNKHAYDSYALNNYRTSVYSNWAHDFCNIDDPDRDFKVDICHLSPPCQFFSDAHTIMGKDDDMNTASLFAIPELIKKAKPRVVTLEQTSGLLRRHELYFNAVVLMFTTLGFSIRWRILNCADFGVPQRRMRIFMIASWWALFPLLPQSRLCSS